MPVLRVFHAEFQRRFTRSDAAPQPALAGKPQEIQIDPSMLFIAAQALCEGPFHFTRLTRISGTIDPAGCTLRHVFFCPDRGEELIVRTEYRGSHPIAMTLATIYPSAQWHEDELEAEGLIQFQAHPECTHPGCVMSGRGTRCVRLPGAHACQ